MVFNMDSNLVTKFVSEKYILLTLNQPETYNAFSKSMITSFSEILKNLNKEHEQKPLLITGAGKSFSSGGNLGLMKEFAEKNKGPEYIKSIVPFVNELISLLVEYKGPTLGIINGSAVGGGFNLAMACDFRIVHEKAKFRLGFIDIGLTPATGNTFFIPKALGIQRTLALSLFSELITAQNLLEWGLANQLYTDITFDEVKELWINKICSLDPWQVYTVRNLLYDGINNSFNQQINLEYNTILEASSKPLFKNKVLKRWEEINSKK